MDSDNEESNDLVLAMGKAGDIEFEPGEEHLVSQFTNESDYCGRKLVTHFKVPGNIHSLEFRSFWTNTLKTMLTAGLGSSLKKILIKK